MNIIFLWNSFIFLFMSLSYGFNEVCFPEIKVSIHVCGLKYIRIVNVVKLLLRIKHAK